MINLNCGVNIWSWILRWWSQDELPRACARSGFVVEVIAAFSCWDIETDSRETCVSSRTTHYRHWQAPRTVLCGRLVEDQKRKSVPENTVVRPTVRRALHQFKLRQLSPGSHWHKAENILINFRGSNTALMSDSPQQIIFAFKHPWQETARDRPESEKKLLYKASGVRTPSPYKDDRLNQNVAWNNKSTNVFYVLHTGESKTRKNVENERNRTDTERYLHPKTRKLTLKRKPKQWWW